MSQRSPQLLPAVTPLEDSRAWTSALRSPSTQVRADASARLHRLLLRAARFELSRRREQLSDVGQAEREDLAVQAADDALMSILRRLDDFRGASRFTTWAYKFALFEAGVKIRRRAWQGREVPLEPEAWSLLASGGSTVQEDVEAAERLAVLGDAIQTELSPHQREVLVAVTLNGIPIDVLAERLNTTRGALYKTTHDARHKLRGALAARGLRHVELGPLRQAAAAARLRTSPAPGRRPPPRRRPSPTGRPAR